MRVHALNQVRKRSVVMIVKLIKLTIVYSVVILLLTGCQKQELIGQFELEGAESVKLLNEEDRAELSYRLKADYPAKNIVNLLNSIISKNNFRACKSSIPSWESFLERPLGRDVARFNRQLVAINKESFEIIFIVLSYTSGSQKLDEPDSSNLGLSVQLFYASDLNQLNEMLDYLSVKCLVLDSRVSRNQ